MIVLEALGPDFKGCSIKDIFSGLEIPYEDDGDCYCPGQSLCGELESSTAEAEPEMWLMPLERGLSSTTETHGTLGGQAFQ